MGIRTSWSEAPSQRRWAARPRLLPELKALTNLVVLFTSEEQEIEGQLGELSAVKAKPSIF